MRDHNHEWRFLRDGDEYKKGYYIFFCQGCLKLVRIKKERIEDIKDAI